MTSADPAGWLSERSRNGGLDEVPLPEVCGRLWLCGKHLIAPDVDRAIERTNASLVVCLNEAYEIEPRYPAYVEWLRAESGHRALWHPIPDLDAPAVEDARALSDAIVSVLASGRSVVAHCGAGIGRAGTLAALVLVRLGTPLPQALAVVAAARPMAGPEAGAQRALLVAFAAVSTS